MYEADQTDKGYHMFLAASELAGTEPLGDPGDIGNHTGLWQVVNSLSRETATERYRI